MWGISVLKLKQSNNEGLIKERPFKNCSNEEDLYKQELFIHHLKTEFKY